MPLQRLTRLAVLLATALVLYRLSVSLPFFPPFLKYDASEVPIVVGALVYGPVAGLLLEVLKNLLHAMLKGGANPIGLAANLSAGILLVGATTLVRGLVPRRWVWVAAAAGAVTMAVVMVPLNLFFFLPAHGIKPSVASTMAVYTLVPFNLVKGLMSAGLGLLFYYRLAPALRMGPALRSHRQ